VSERNIVPNLAKKMSSVLLKEAVALIRRIGVLSDSLGFEAFIVGGPVRDIILGVGNLDLDIAVEGRAIELGRLLAGELKADITAHRRFGTCTVTMGNGIKIDLATARKEIYERPAALPSVKFSSLKDDLVRRDFTVNAMAISINPSDFGRLIDPFGGRQDLARGRIRILHDGSFIDDPTRIFRAMRFKSRFGFTIDRHTEDLIKSALEGSTLDRISRERLRNELILMLKERRPFEALKVMADFGGLDFLHSGIKFDGNSKRLYDSIYKTCALYECSSYRKRAPDRWLIYLMALFGDLTYGRVSAVCGRLAFKSYDRYRLLSCKKDAHAVARSLSSKRCSSPSEVYKLLRPLSLEVILFIMAGTALMSSKRRAALVRSRIRAFLAKYERTRLCVRGGDLKAAGLKSGPAFKMILDKILYGRMDGKLKTERDELKYARALADRMTSGRA